MSSYHHHLPRKLGTTTGVTPPPSLVDCSSLLKYGGKLSCCTALASAAASRRSDPSSDAPRMPPPIPPLPPFGGTSPTIVVGHPRLTWGTVLRDLGLRPFSSDSSYGGIFGPSLVWRYAGALQRWASALGWGRPLLSTPPLPPSPPLLGHDDPSWALRSPLYALPLRGHWQALPSHQASTHMDLVNPCCSERLHPSLADLPLGKQLVEVASTSPASTTPPLWRVELAPCLSFLSAPLRWDLGEMAGLAVSP